MEEVLGLTCTPYLARVPSPLEKVAELARRMRSKENRSGMASELLAERQKFFELGDDAMLLK